MNYPYARAMRIGRDIDGEIVAVIRFVLLDIRAGRSLFETLKDLSKNFKYTGHITRDVIKSVELGSTFEEALTEKANEVESEYFRVLVWQMLNHLKTGTDIGDSLRTISHEIEEKQKIDFKEFGKKLNAMSVLYMVIAIILPSIGFTMFAAFLIFIGFEVNTWLIVLIWAALTFMQVLFVISSTSNKPPMDID
jgi:pilus assembly protein TadC